MPRITPVDWKTLLKIFKVLDVNIKDLMDLLKGISKKKDIWEV